MAYKFQRGAAILSGSIKAEDGLVSTDVDDATAANVVAQIDNGEIAIAKLAQKSLSVAGKSADLGGSIDLDDLTVDNSSLQLDAGTTFDGSAAKTISVKALGITNAMLAGSIASSKISELNAFNTANLAEGSNLYYTDARARAAVSVVDNGGDGSLSYNSSNGQFTYTGPSAAEVRAHLSVSDTPSIDMSFAGGAFSAAVILASNSGLDDSAGLKLATSTAGQGLELVSGVYNVRVSASNGIAIDTDKLKLDIGGMPAQIASAVAAGDLMIMQDISDAHPKKITAAAFADFIEGNGMAADASGQLNINVDGSSIEIDSDSLRVKALGITNAMLAGSIASGKIAELNSFDTGDLSEGSNLYYTDARARASVSAVDAGGDGSFAYNASNGQFTYTGPSASEVRAHLSAGTGVTYSGGQFSIGQAVATSSDVQFKDISASGDVVVTGNLTVNGTQTVLNTATLEVEDLNIKVAKNAANSSAADGAGLTIEMGANDLSFGWLHASQRMELKLGSNYADLKVKKLIADDIEATIAEGIQSFSSNASVNLANGTILLADPTGGDVTLDLPAAGAHTGKIVKVKKAVASANNVILTTADSGRIDGEESIVLESDFAGVSLICNGTHWFVM
tara:strand:+ start:6481 stop:8349 length:1869 start_codon:yes stop_codon:yes gene_type:complete